MIRHYFKIAIRNLLKYKTQTAISILGLSIGFTCFALSSLWIHYEMTYDDFHEEAEQIYCVRQETANAESGLSSVNPYPLAAYLKETFAEVKGACSIICSENCFKLNGELIKLKELKIDSAAFSVFHINVLEGSKDFLQNGKDRKIAITKSCAHRLFGQKNPIGKEIYSSFNNEPFVICAIVSEWPDHSNLTYDIVGPTRGLDIWFAANWQTFVRVQKNTNATLFAQKLYNHVIKKAENTITHLVITPITALRYDRPNKEADIKLKHVILFAISGGLVVLCSLLNYMTLFISHIRMRGKELALRTVCGSSSKGLFLLLMSEFLILLFLSLFVGMLFIEIIIPEFKELATINLGRIEIYTETLLYCLATIFFAILFSALPVYYYRRKSIQSILMNQKDGKGKNLFRKISVVFQLFISISFIFCSLLIMKQLHYLTHTDAGMNRKNIASITLFPTPDIAMVGDKIKQIPEIKQVLVGHNSLLPSTGATLYAKFEEWDGKQADTEALNVEINQEDSTYANFYGFHILEGEMITPSSPKTDIVLNETAVKKLGWTKAIGKNLYTKAQDSTSMRVIGVMKDYYSASPTSPVHPICYVKEYSNKSFFFDNDKKSILFKYKDGTWKICKHKIEQLLKTEYPDTVINIYNAEEEFDKYLKSENALLKLLGSISFVCIIISIFAIYSLVTLTCEQRKKEIAVRKVNGATISSILSMFMKEYYTLLLIATVTAFPISYTIMKYWLEGYTKQTDISLWIYLVIFCGIAFIMAISIIWRIWKAANENPAKVIKSE